MTSNSQSSPLYSLFQNNRAQKYARVFMWALALMNLAFLIWVVIDPIPTAHFVGLAAHETQAQAELRAMYGGLIGGIGVLNLLGALHPHRLSSALWCTAWTFTGVGVVRTVSCVLLGIGGVQALFAALEIGASLTSFTLLSFLGRASSSQS